MFDISFAELIVIGIVALVVIGPERLPAVARTVGYFLGRARRYVERVKHDLHEEMELDSFRKLRDSVHETVNSFEGSVRKEMNEIHKSADIRPAAILEKDPPVHGAGKDSMSEDSKTPPLPSSAADSRQQDNNEARKKNDQSADNH